MSKIALLVGICLIFVSCGKDPSGVPDVSFSFRVSIFGDPKYSGLSTSNGFVEVPGYGVAGLIIYRTPFDELVAYDRCSTVNPEKECAVHVDATALTATDPCSGAIFLLLDGSAQKTPAKKPLKKYYVTESNGQISVSN